MSFLFITQPAYAQSPVWLEISNEETPWGDYCRPLDQSALCFDPQRTLDCSPGTLFRWNYSGEAIGGPDLNAPLVTDRPDFTEAASTVGRGVLQIESGYTFFSNNDDGEQTRLHSYGEFLFRYGVLANWLELRIGVFPLQERTQLDSISDSTAGVGDLYLGLKLGLTPQQGVFPEMALIPQMFIPTGHPAFTSDQIEPGLNLIYKWEINDFVSTAGSTQGNRRVDVANEAYAEIAQSWTVAYSLTDKLGAYTEWFGLFPHSSENALPQNYFNGGFTYLLNNNMQFDIRAGVGLNEAADDYFAGGGFSIRFR